MENNYRRHSCFNHNWLFKLGDDPEGFKPELNDETWQQLMFRMTGALSTP